MALSGIHMLLNFNMIPFDDIKNILRVLSIQISRSDAHLKMLQILVQLLSMIELDGPGLPDDLISEQMLLSFLTISIQLSDSKGSVSVGTTGLATTRQITMFIIRHCSKEMSSGEGKEPSTACHCLFYLLNDLCSFVLHRPSDWLKSVQLSFQVSQDLLYDILVDQSALLRNYPLLYFPFLQEKLIPTIRVLVRNVNDHFLLTVSKFGLTTAGSTVSRSLRLVSVLLMEHWHLRFFESYLDLLRLLVHLLQPTDLSPDALNKLSTSLWGNNSVNNNSNNGGNAFEDAFRARFDEASALFSKFQMLPAVSAVSSVLHNASGGSLGRSVVNSSNGGGVPSNNSISGSSSPTAISSASLATLCKSGPLAQPGVLLTLLISNQGSVPVAGNTAGSASSQQISHIVCHVAGRALEVLLTFFMSRHFVTCLIFGSSLSNFDQVRSSFVLKELESIWIDVAVTCSTILQGGLGVDVMKREWEEQLRSSMLVTFLEGVFSGVEDYSWENVSGNLHDLLSTKQQGIMAHDLLTLSLFMVQGTLRLLSHVSLRILLWKNNSPSTPLVSDVANLLSLSNLNISVPVLSSLPFFNFDSHVAMWRDELLLYAKDIENGYFIDCPHQKSVASILGLLDSDVMLFQRDAINNMTTFVSTIMENFFPHWIVSWTSLIEISDSGLVVRRCVGMLAEGALIGTCIEEFESSNSFLHHLCKLSVPLWHGLDWIGSSSNGAANVTWSYLAETNASLAPTTINSSSIGNSNNSSGVASSTNTSASSASSGSISSQNGDSSIAKLPFYWHWKHQLCLEKVLQLLHFLGNSVWDWDVALDTLEQVMFCLRFTFEINGGSSPSSISSLPFPIETSQILKALDRFKMSTSQLCDESLVKLMTSLVSLSMNSMGNRSVAMKIMKDAAIFGSNNLKSGSDTIQASSGLCRQQWTSMASIVRRRNKASLKENSNKGKSVTSGDVEEGIVEIDSAYLKQGISDCFVGFSLQSVIEITKLNGHRAAVIWQMVTSHLRVLASQKWSPLRIFAVQASYDLMTFVLNFYDDNNRCDTQVSLLSVNDCLLSPLGSSSGSNKASDAIILDKNVPRHLLDQDTCSLVTDEVVFAYIFPPYESSFQLPSSVFANVISLTTIGLSKAEILSSLKILISIRYEDVREEVLRILEGLLQNGSTSLQAGTWGSISEVLSTIPESMKRRSENSLEIESDEVIIHNNERFWQRIDERNEDLSRNSQYDRNISPIVEYDDFSVDSFEDDTPSCMSDGSYDNSDEVASTPRKSIKADNNGFPPGFRRDSETLQWSRNSLNDSFDCMKLIIDEYLDLLDFDDVLKMISCLTVFAQQTLEVNISLTSVEMMWKVADVTITKYFLLWKKNKAQSLSSTSADNFDFNCSEFRMIDQILSTMTENLRYICLDFRPEIRLCAINTLFAAISANSSRISHLRWSSLFRVVLFPLLRRITYLSSDMRLKNEQAVAPELKKGVKMTIHHSRDTAFKQWSETSVVMLRGLNKIVKILVTIPSTFKLVHNGSMIWFFDVWNQALHVGQLSLDSSRHTKEVSVAGVDLLFSMLKSVSSSSSSPSVPLSNNISSMSNSVAIKQQPGQVAVDSTSAKKVDGSVDESIEKIRKEEEFRTLLWNSTWTCLVESCLSQHLQTEVSLQFLSQLQSYYASHKEQEFRYSAVSQSLFSLIVALSRYHSGQYKIETKRDADGQSNVFEELGWSYEAMLAPLQKTSNNMSDQLTCNQLQRNIVEFWKALSVNDAPTFNAWLSGLSQIVWAGNWIRVDLPPVWKTSVNDSLKSCIKYVSVLGPSSRKLREEALDLIQSVIHTTESEESAPAFPAKQFYRSALMNSPSSTTMNMSVLSVSIYSMIWESMSTNIFSAACSERDRWVLLNHANMHQRISSSKIVDGPNFVFHPKIMNRRNTSEFPSSDQEIRDRVISKSSLTASASEKQKIIEPTSIFSTFKSLFLESRQKDLVDSITASNVSMNSNGSSGFSSSDLHGAGSSRANLPMHPCYPFLEDCTQLFRIRWGLFASSIEMVYLPSLLPLSLSSLNWNPSSNVSQSSNSVANQVSNDLFYKILRVATCIASPWSEGELTSWGSSLMLSSWINHYPTSGDSVSGAVSSNASRKEDGNDNNFSGYLNFLQLSIDGLFAKSRQARW